MLVRVEVDYWSLAKRPHAISATEIRKTVWNKVCELPGGRTPRRWESGNSEEKALYARPEHGSRVKTTYCKI
jgi:hypothetical protein